MSDAKPSEQFRASRILFFAIISGALIFFLVSLFVNQTQGPLAPDLLEYRRTLEAVMIFLSVVGMSVAKLLFKKRITIVKDSLISLPEKLNKYISSLIIFLVICEAPILINIILFLLTGNFSFLVYAAVVVGYMIANAPTRKRVVDWLGLDMMQEAELKN